MASTINLLRLLADPTRLRLLLLLEQEELSVAELQQILGMGQSRISSHLAQLKRAGVVADRRVGKECLLRREPQWAERAARACGGDHSTPGARNARRLARSHKSEACAPEAAG